MGRQLPGRRAAALSGNEKRLWADGPMSALLLPNLHVLPKRENIWARKLLLSSLDADTHPAPCAGHRFLRFLDDPR